MTVRGVRHYRGRDNDHLHEVLMGLPLYPYMEMKITPLCRHPSSIREDDS